MQHDIEVSVSNQPDDDYYRPFRAEIDKRRWTAVDNLVIEEFQPRMSAHAFCVLVHIIRLTTGFHVESVQISIRQLEEKTGFSRPTVLKAIEALTSPQLPCLRVVYPGDRTTAATYALNTDLRIKKVGKQLPATDDCPTEVVKEIDHGGKELLPQVVKEIDRSKERVNKVPLSPRAAVHMPPEEDSQVLGEMINTLVEVTQIPAKTGGSLNRAFREKHLPLARALLADGYTATQIMQWYGDRSGYWFNGDFRGRDKGERPSHRAIEETVMKAREWRPSNQPASRSVNGRRARPAARERQADPVLI